MDKDDQKTWLHDLACIFLGCFFLSIALLFLTFVFYLVAGDLGFSIHSKFFEISMHNYDLLIYYGMAFIKMCAILFFLFPYISIKLVIRKREKNR